MDKIKGLCWFCKKEKVMELTQVEKYRGNEKEAYLCPDCNASNSKVRVEEDIKKGKAKEIS